MPSREEVANTMVAQVLERLLGITVQAELSGRTDGRKPDIFIHKYNAVLEAKFDDFDSAVKAAEKRWEEMEPTPAIVGALSYDPLFRKNAGKAIYENALIEFAFSGDPKTDLAAQKRTGTVDDIARLLGRPNAILHPQEDEIKQAIGAIEGALGVFYGMLKSDKGTLSSMAKVLQANTDAETEKVLEQTARVGGLILLGALLFQISLARVNESVERPLPEKVSELREHWQYILTKINYVAIFGIAGDLLACGVNLDAVKMLAKTAEKLETSFQDGLDLMGRIYHMLLADAKALGAFYTSMPAATLMAGLALSPADWGKNEEWANLDFIRKFRIGDPACGSGTLLAAACWQMRNNFISADAKVHGITVGGKEKTHPLKFVQKILLEEVVWGYDILETAAHLTATTLGLMAPDVDFQKAHIYRTIIGFANHRFSVAAGSLEFLRGDPILARDEHVEKEKHADKPPELDLFIMNPPFVRGTVDHESFSFLPSEEQKGVQDQIRLLGRNHGFTSGHGQGAGFVALATQQRSKGFRVKTGGRIATILPSTFAVGMGDAWSKARKSIEKHFDLEVLIVSREHERPNFSENTQLQECIAIARKRPKNKKPSSKALFVVLTQNPRTMDEAHATVRAINVARKSQSKIGDLRTDGVNTTRHDRSGIIGQFAFLKWSGKRAWNGVSFANLHLALAAENFAETGKLSPLVRKGNIKLTPLGELGTIGSHTLDLRINHRKVKERKCVISPGKTNYPGYYPGYHRAQTGVSQRNFTNISENPHCYCLPLPGYEEWAEDYWAKAGYMVICQSFRFNTMRRLVALISEPVQTSHYWPIKLWRYNLRKYKALTLWLNSTPALFLFTHYAQSTDGPKVNLSQAAVSILPVADINALNSSQLNKLARVFDKIVKGEGFLPIPQMENDSTRILIDNVFSEIYGLGDLAPLRAALAKEPIIHGKQII